MRDNDLLGAIVALVIAVVVFAIAIPVYFMSAATVDYDAGRPMAIVGEIEGYDDASTEFVKTMVHTSFGSYRVKASLSGQYGEPVGLQDGNLCFPKRQKCYEVY